MRIPSDLIPKCPDDGSNVTTNLRADDSFVEDEGWHEASANYAQFLRKNEGGHVLYLELGVGSNTPVIIKFPFWTMTYDNPDAVYACLNYNEAYAPKQIAGQSICINGDTGEVLKELAEILKYMAPYCVCLHIKDYVIKRYNGGSGLKITGASMGTGRLDICRCYEECRIKSNRDFNIILESWMEPCDTLEETLRIEDEWAGAGVSYLKALL